MRTLFPIALVSSLLTTACSSGDCTDIGAESQVVVRFGELAHERSDQPLEIEACLEDFCQTVVYPSDHIPNPEVGFGEDVVTDGTPRRVRLTVTDARGTQLFTGTTTVTPEKRQVNGESCPPTTWHAVAEVSDDGKLVPAKVPSGE